MDYKLIVLSPFLTCIKCFPKKIISVIHIHNTHYFPTINIFSKIFYLKHAQMYIQRNFLNLYSLSIQHRLALL